MESLWELIDAALQFSAAHADFAKGFSSGLSTLIALILSYLQLRQGRPFGASSFSGSRSAGRQAPVKAESPQPDAVPTQAVAPQPEPPKVVIPDYTDVLKYGQGGEEAFQQEMLRHAYSMPQPRSVRSNIPASAAYGGARSRGPGLLGRLVAWTVLAACGLYLLGWLNIPSVYGWGLMLPPLVLYIFASSRRTGMWLGWAVVITLALKFYLL